MVLVMVTAVSVAIPCVTALVRWTCYLRFCRFLVRETKSSASLKDAAIAARAFSAPTDRRPELSE